MPFSAAARTSPCSWEPYLSNNVQNTNNNPPECRQPVKTKWVVDVLRLQMKIMTPKTYFAIYIEMYVLSYTIQQYRVG